MTTVRQLRPDDRVTWTELWAGYLRFYRAEVGLAAEADDGTVVGLAHCVLHPSTWSRGGTCYLEDLYVDPGHRGTGAARALIEAAGEQGRAAGAETLYWHTQAFNGRARSLYDTVAQLTSFVHYERELG